MTPCLLNNESKHSQIFEGVIRLYVPSSYIATMGDLLRETVLWDALGESRSASETVSNWDIRGRSHEPWIFKPH
jgi:hypothetical protein